MKRQTILLIAVLACLAWQQIRLTHSVRLLEAKTSVQIGMSEDQATRIMGQSPRVIKERDHLNRKLTFANVVRSPGDKVLLYSSVYPSSYIVVHLSPKGFVDAILFMES